VEALTVARLTYHSAVKPCRGQFVSGDATLLLEQNDGVMAVICDGLGHGRPAFEVSRAVNAWVEKQTTRDPEALVLGLHEVLKGSIGAAVGMAWINTTTMALRYAGIGNTVGKIFGGRERSLISRPGTLGIAVASVRVQEDVLSPGDFLVLHTDGISSNFTLVDYPMMLHDKAETATGEVMRRFGKDYDDSSCIVVKCSND